MGEIQRGSCCVPLSFCCGWHDVHPQPLHLVQGLLPCRPIRTHVDHALPVDRHCVSINCSWSLWWIAQKAHRIAVHTTPNPTADSSKRMFRQSHNCQHHVVPLAASLHLHVRLPAGSISDPHHHLRRGV